jgi:PAS domain S-box-containing protein
LNRTTPENKPFPWHPPGPDPIGPQEYARCLYEGSRRAERRYLAFLEFLPEPVFVFNMDGTVSYLNPAFEKVFGWTLQELEGKRIPFVPESLRERTRIDVQQFFQDGVISDYETRRLTKDGRLLDIILNGAIFYGENDEPAGQIIVLRDVTREKRAARSNQALFRIATAIPRFRSLNGLLEFIIKEVQDLISVDGASIILLDQQKQEFYFSATAYGETDETGKKMREIRFPADKGVAGQVYKTGMPLIVPDTSQSPYFFRSVDERAGYETRSMLDVPIRTQDRMVGVLCAVNKKGSAFDQADVLMMSTVAGMVALPIENARINEELNRSYEEVKSLNRAKDRVIHHLSHELKTPISVLSASLDLISKKLSQPVDGHLERILERAQRNLQRLLEMQYEIEDILRERDYNTYHMLTVLLETCTDEIEALIESEMANVERGIRNAEYGMDLFQGVRRRIEELFGPKESVSESIRLDRFTQGKIDSLRPRFAHRRVLLETRMEPVSAIRIPPDVLSKIVEGLVRNAVENTPDGSRIEVTVRKGPTGPQLEVKDFGIGITEENQRLVFESYLTTTETMQYSSRRPYDFNAGGKGFDLLRLKIFSERYDFKLHMASRRCGHLPQDSDLCPGKVEHCAHCVSEEDCCYSGGTTMTVSFPIGH